MASTKKDNELQLNIPVEGVKTKLQLARVQLQKRNLSKTGDNKFANFKFFQLEDFITDVNEIFAKLGLHSEFNITPQIIAYEESIAYNEEGKTLATTKKPIIKEMATLEITDVQKPEEVEIYEMEVAPVMIGNNSKQNIYQAAGGRNTYYKRYLYMNALEIVESDESDATLGQPGVVYNQQSQMTPYDFMPQPAQQINQAVHVNPKLGQNSPMKAQPVNNVLKEDDEVYGTTDSGVPIGLPTHNLNEVAETIENTTAQIVSGNEPLSIESKMEIMNLVNQKGLNGAEVIGNFCRQNGLSGTNDLLESHKQMLINMING